MYLSFNTSKGKSMIRATHSGGPNFEILTKFFCHLAWKMKKIFFSGNHLRMSWNGEKSKNFFLTSRTLFRSFYTQINGSPAFFWVWNDHFWVSSNLTRSHTVNLFNRVRKYSSTPSPDYKNLKISLKKTFFAPGGQNMQLNWFSVKDS